MTVATPDAQRSIDAARSRTGSPPAAGHIGGVSRLPHLVHVAGGRIGPDADNGVSRAVYHLAQAQRAVGHQVDTIGERTGRMRPASAALIREVLDQRPDIVHLHSIHVIENISLARHLRAAGVPYCVTIHGGLHNQRRGRMKKTALWWLGERQYLNNARFIHALTRLEAQDITAYGVTAPIVIAPNGIDVGSLPPIGDGSALTAKVPQLAGHRVFMFMGRVAPIQKGLDLLLEGLALANLPDHRLVILGPDFRDGRATLEALADRLGVRSQVTFLDGETPERCADLMGGADVFVHTSRWEGMSLSVLEAAGWAKPSLLTRAADPNGALAQDRGAVVVDDTPQGIAAGLREIAAFDRAALQAMGQRAHRTVVTHFTWNRAATTLRDAYRGAEALSGR